MNEYMSRQLADLNVYVADESFERACREATAKLNANPNASSAAAVINIEGVDFPLELCKKPYPKFVPHISLLHRQKSVFNIVLKIVKNPTRKVEYSVSIVDSSRGLVLKMSH